MSGSGHPQSHREIPVTSVFSQENALKQSHPKDKINSYLCLMCNVSGKLYVK